jgi:hypothetical protein
MGKAILGVELIYPRDYLSIIQYKNMETQLKKGKSAIRDYARAR